MVVELMDGRFMRFLIVPFRKIKEADLKPLPYWQSCGNNSKEASEYFYKLYGFEKRSAS